MIVRAALVPALLLLIMSAALGQDVAGSSDHPLVGRFTGSTIIYYKSSANDQAALLQAPHDYGALLNQNMLSDRTGAEWLPTGGKITKIRYEVPPGHGALEVSKSYQAALEARGFSVLFECADAACLTGSLTDDYLLGQQLDPDNSDTTRYSANTRYFLAALGASSPTTQPDPGTPMTDLGGPGSPPDLDQGMGGPGSPVTDPGGPGSPPADLGGPGSDATDANDPCADPTDLTCGVAPAPPPTASAQAYVAILVGEDQALTTAFVEVVEPAGAADLAGNVAVVHAQQMATQLDSNGSINIYGLHFDTGSAALKAESRATLEQIVQLLQSQPQLRLAVVGHTDTQGGANYNMQLSTKRAQSVVAALVGDYGIAPDRLEPAGRGYTQPIASNDTEDGRAQNRRVELVALPPGSAPASSPTAAVDTTIYAKPAGKEIGYLRTGDPVTIASCDDIGWCTVTAPLSGYVWGPDLSK